MIVPMKKLSLVTIRRRESETLDRLRDLGVLHIERAESVNDRGESLREERSRIEKVIAAIPAPDHDPTASDMDRARAVDESLTLAEEVESCVERRSALTEKLDRIGRAIEMMEPWGEFDPREIGELADAGVRIRLYQIAPERFESIDLPNIIVLSREKTVIRAVSVAIGDETFPDEPLSFEPADRAISALREEYDATRSEIDENEAKLAACAEDLPVLLAAIEGIDSAIEYADVQANMDGDEELSWLTGYLPTDLVDDVRSAAKNNGWGIVVRDPDDDDPVPTQVRNPKAIRIINPIFQLLGTVPGYREFDISFLFLLFLTVFFAMIIGDGGYGLVLLAGTVYATIKTRTAGKPVGEGLILMLVFSVATVAWGAITGNWFGYTPFAQLPVLRSLVIPAISTANATSNYTVQYVCFIIGTIHLSIAHLWGFVRAVRQKPRIAALAQLGWLSVVLGLYYLVLNLVLDPRLVMPPWAVPMIGGGLAAVIIFGAQEEGTGFLAGVGKGFANLITTVLDGVSAFSDIISYIRLFAVGLASLAIAEAFNEMAGGIGAALDGVIGIIAAAVVLMLGHTLNLAMGALSVVVHGVRLNMLEFSGHLGMEWTGVRYAPFKSREKQGEVA
jgi:V/A-type H+-transporting ATPase subunit I